MSYTLILSPSRGLFVTTTPNTGTPTDAQLPGIAELPNYDPNPAQRHKLPANSAEGTVRCTCVTPRQQHQMQSVPGTREAHRMKGTSLLRLLLLLETPPLLSHFSLLFLLHSTGLAKLTPSLASSGSANSDGISDGVDLLARMLVMKL